MALLETIFHQANSIMIFKKFIFYHKNFYLCKSAHLRKIHQDIRMYKTQLCCYILHLRHRYYYHEHIHQCLKQLMINMYYNLARMFLLEQCSKIFLKRNTGPTTNGKIVRYSKALLDYQSFI